MARVGGRNAVVAWIVGILCLAAVAVIAFLASPLLPTSIAWLKTAVDPSATGSTGATSVATDEETTAEGLPAECSDLYDDALWAALRFADGAELTSSQDAPVTTASALVTALKPQVLLTCSWDSDAGTVSTTLATVPPDAGAIAEAALPGAGFACEDESDRTRCTRTDGDLVETIEAGDGLWVSTSEDAWHPGRLASAVAERVWG
ncbi:MAG: hypothetical protein QM677_07970 [Microbacterium sp.]